MKVYFDLDGVLANFDKMCAGILNMHYWDRTDNSHWTKLDKIPHLFYGMEVLPDALTMFDYVVGHVGLNNVEILTALPHPTNALDTAEKDKRAWVADVVHPDIVVNTVLGGVNKVKFLKDNPSAILIDDYERNIKLWIEHGGIGILHTDAHSTLAKLKTLGI